MTIVCIETEAPISRFITFGVLSTTGVFLKYEYTERQISERPKSERQLYGTEICVINLNAIDLNGSYVLVPFGFGYFAFGIGTSVQIPNMLAPKRKVPVRKPN